MNDRTLDAIMVVLKLIPVGLVAFLLVMLTLLWQAWLRADLPMDRLLVSMTLSYCVLAMGEVLTSFSGPQWLSWSFAGGLTLAMAVHLVLVLRRQRRLRPARREQAAAEQAAREERLR